MLQERRQSEWRELCEACISAPSNGRRYGTPCKGAAGQAVASEMAQRLRTESKYIDETVVEYQTVNVCNGGV